MRATKRNADLITMNHYDCLLTSTSFILWAELHL